MKHIYNFFLYAGILMVLSCTNVPLPAKENIFKNKVFVHLYFSTEKECIEAQPDPDFFINCHQQLDFLGNNEVHIMLTDIIYIGTYEVSGKYLIVYVENSPEIPEGEIIFEIVNPTKLIKLDDKTMWKKVSGNSIWN